jgi:hypothetical protein
VERQSETVGNLRKVGPVRIRDWYPLVSVSGLKRWDFMVLGGNIPFLLNSHTRNVSCLERFQSAMARIDFR